MHCAARCPPRPAFTHTGPPAQLFQPRLAGQAGVGLLHRIHESPGHLVFPEQLFHLFQVSDPELHRAAMPADEQLRP